MSGLTVKIAGPSTGSTVSRRLSVSGSISVSGGIFDALVSVEIRLGATGQFFSVSSDPESSGWSWDGPIPMTIRPGQTFRITVRASAEIFNPKTKEIDFVEGQASVDVFLENVVPTLTIDPFQSPVVVKQPPGRGALQGSVDQANPAVYGVPKLRYRIGNGAFTELSVFRDTVLQKNRWRLELPPGNHAITLEAYDGFGSVTTGQANITVLKYEMPTDIDPAAKTTLAGVPTTSSITTWTRLEPQCSGADIGGSSSARLFDPLWLMTRQWQMGEFQGEDTGSPVEARVRATSALLTRSYFGELPWDNKAPPYDPTLFPLEVLVERQRMRPADDKDPRMLTLAVETGLHFLRMLEQSATGRKYRPAFLARYLLQPPPTSPVDEASRRYVETMAGRAPDGRRLAAAFRTPDAPRIAFDPALNILAADLAPLQQIAAAWLAWYDGLFPEPGARSQDAWVPKRLEYAISVAARLSADPEDALTLSASEFDGGRLDWSSFDVNMKEQVDTTGDQAPIAIHEATVPAPVSFHGMPAPRFWEMEDAKIAYGLISAGPTDLAQLLMIEYASSYGNDWYVVPLTLPVGSVTRMDSLVVTDTFGVSSLLRPIGDPALSNPCFSLWQVSIKRHGGEELGSEISPGKRIGEPVPNRFFLPPTLGRTIDGAPLEDVLFMRDEMANMAWGIERSIESAIEAPLALSRNPAPAAPPPAATPGAEPRYRLATTVPDNWIPLLPVQPEDKGTAVSLLRRGAVLHPDGTNRVQHARSEVLKALGTERLFDEEVPREGTHITRRRRMARWIDGSTWVWTAFRNEVGTGEGSAGLRFDQLEGGEQP